MKAQPNILVVEDEGITAWDIEQSLVELGFGVCGIVGTAEDAVIKARASSPDLVLMDIRLQRKGDGIEAALQIRRELDLPIVYLTSHNDRETLDRAKQTEPLAYLLKPFRRGELQSVLEMALHRHAIERRLRERERLLSTTLQSIGDAVVTIDPDGWVTTANPAALALLDPDRVFARPLTEVLDLREEWTDDPIHLPPPRRLRGAHEVAGARIGTGKRVVSIQLSPVVDDDELLGAVLVIRDLTRERDVQQQLEVADRLSTFGMMASAVSHEINNPLAYVLGNLQYSLEALRRESSTPPEVQDALREAVDGCDRIARITRDLRSFNRPDAPVDDRVDVHRPLTWAIDVCSQVALGRAEIQHRFGDVPPVRADETRLGQVFVNLLTNAVQALPERGVRRVEVLTRTDPQGDVEVSVSDTGVGMNELVLSRIFDPFYTTKPPGIGTGLGLSVCRAIVASLGGRITASSTPGSGSVFVVTLPRSRRGVSTPPSAEPRQLPNARPRARRRRRRRGARTARPHPAEAADVTTERSAQATLERLARRPYDVILCDALMPELSGLEVFRTIRERQPELAERFVLVTGGATFEEAAAAGEPLPTHRLLKPFDPSRLRALVARIAGQRLRGDAPGGA
ncbi:MAG: response regulator [Myxococcota bacterium]